MSKDTFFVFFIMFLKQKIATKQFHIKSVKFNHIKIEWGL